MVYRRFGKIAGTGAATICLLAALAAGLVALRASNSPIESGVALLAHALWLTVKALRIPAAILGVAFGVERWLTGFDGDRRRPAQGLLINIIFLSLTYWAVLLARRMLPLRGVALISMPSGQGWLGSGLFFLASLAIYLMAYDLLFYWTHRALHRVPLLWKFHAVHHGPQLDALHAFTHPVDMVVRYCTIVGPLSLVIGVEQPKFYWVVVAVAVQNQLLHMNAPMHFGVLGKLLVDNRYHFLHHSSEPRFYGRNFATIFALTDRLFGTHQAPGRGPLPQTGFISSRGAAGVSDMIFGRIAVPGSSG